MLNPGRILTALATLLAILVGVALGAPALMSWDHLRGPAEAKARARLGVPVRIDGRITVQALPSPRISFGDVVIEPGTALPFSGDFARVQVHLSVGALMGGRVEPSSVRLAGADLVVDREALIDEDRFAKIALPVTLTGGRLHFEAGNTAPEITEFALRAEPRRRDGSRLRMTGRFKERPFSFRAALDGKEPTVLRLARLDFGDGEAMLSLARPTGSGRDAEIRMRLIEGEAAIALLGRLLPSVGQNIHPEEVARLGPLSLIAQIRPDGEAVELSQLEVTAGPVRLTGSGRFRPGARPGLELELGARTLVLGGGKGPFDPSGLLRVLGQLAEWGGQFDGHVRLYADHILAGGSAMRNSEVRLSFSPEGSRLDRFRVSLPNGLSVSGQGAAAEKGQLAATVRLDGARLADVMTGLPGESGPGADAQTPLTVEGRLVLSGVRAALNDLRIAAGRNDLRADGALYFGERTAVELRVEGGQLDLRPYGLSWEGLTSGLSVEGIWDRLTALAKAADVTVRFDLAEVRLTDETLRDGVFDLALDERQVVLRRLSLEGAGRAVEARLRMPVSLKAEKGDDNAGGGESWTARAEAAVDLRTTVEGGVGWRAGLWDGVLSLETETPVRSRLAGRLTHGQDGFRWTGIKGRIGKASVTGELALVPGDRMAIQGTIMTDAANIQLTGGKGDHLWPDWPLSRYRPQGVDIHLDWMADELTIVGARLSEVKGSAVLEKDAVRLVMTSAVLYGGTASGSASLSFSPDDMMIYESHGVVQRADLTAIMGGGWQGRGTFRQSTSGSGSSISEIVSGLRGTVGLSFEEGRIGGFDAGRLAASLPALERRERIDLAVNDAFGKGTTPFRRLEGEAKLGNGELVLSGISAQTNTGPIMLAGIVNLPARLIAAQADVSLGDKIGTPLSVQFIGRMEAPERMVDTERLAKRLGQ